MKNEWNNTVSHPLQSWEWGEFRKNMGIDVVRVNKYQLTFHKLPHLPFTIGYFPKGPNPNSEMIKVLKQIGKEKKAIFIQLEPNSILSFPRRRESIVPEAIDPRDHPMKDAPRMTIKGLIPSHHPLFTKYTFILDLTKSEDQLLKDMHSKTRYNIKVAQKHGVVIKEDSSDNAFADYLKLTSETTQRQGFYAHTPLYHQCMWETLHPTGVARLWTATYQNQTLASWIIFCFGDTIYYPYGASSREYREVMAPVLLLWEIAKWGKQQGYKKFDLWGAMGPNPDVNDPWYGFHRFKEGFKPDLVEFVGSYDLIINPLLYRLYCFADTLRWKLLKMKQ